MKKVGVILVLALAIVGGMESCKKGDGKSRLTVKMKDAPGDFQQVNVEILEVNIHYSGEGGDQSGWVALPTNAGIYDLLELQNNVLLVLTDPADIPSGKVTSMRLILGNGNSVMVDDVTYPLITPSAQNTGLKISLKTILLEDESYEVLIDFDAEKSVVIEGNGNYLLKPVIKVESITTL